MSNSMSFISKVQKVLVKNAPTILSVMGGIGACATAILAADGAVKAAKKIEEAENDISTPDKVAIYAKECAPALIMLTATEICIYKSNKINQQRIAALAGAYILSETNFSEYKSKVEEVIGKKKASEVDDEMVHQHILATPQTPLNTCQTNLPNPVQLSLWFDDLSRRYFYSNGEYIRKAELAATNLLREDGFVGVNDVYDLLGIESIPLGDGQGWVYDPDHGCTEVRIKIGADVMGPDIPVGTITMNVRPIHQFGWVPEES